MADRKISASTELAAEPATGDLFPVVDVSDTTDAATGTVKKILWSTLKAIFAVAAKGVTNGDSHYHSGGDGAAIVAAATSFAATDKLLGRATAGAGAGEEISLTAAGRALLDDASAADQLTTLGVTAAGQALLDDANAAAQLTTLGAAAASHAHAGTDITSGSIDGDRLPAISTSKKGAVPATGVASGKFLKDDGSWTAIAGGGDMLASTYDTDADGVVENSDKLAGTTPTAAGLALLDDADAAAQLTTLGAAGVTTTQTLTNKRITPRIGTDTTNATPTPAGDSADMYTVTALAENATFAAPTGTPTNGQKLIIRIKDNATARTLGWNAIYRAMGVALPTTTVISKTMYLGFIYNSADTKWDLIAKTEEA